MAVEPELGINKMLKIRTGFGIDIHQLKEGYPLYIGGVKLYSSFGAVGHSDADVLLHAICDALLGAANLRDIGFHFSDTDPQYKGIDSQVLLKETFSKIKEKGYKLSNLDATVLLENPKVNPHISEMQIIISKILEVDVDAISIKATRGEKMGYIGNGNGIQAYCSVLIYQ